jgi:hypothetical protein
VVAIYPGEFLNPLILFRPKGMPLNQGLSPPILAAHISPTWILAISSFLSQAYEMNPLPLLFSMSLFQLTIILIRVKLLEIINLF